MNACLDAISAEHLKASLQVIGINVNAYYSGATYTYRPIAAELRKLLCDTKAGKDVSLLPRCFPGIQLHPLVGSQSMLDEHTVLYIPSRVSFDGRGGSEIEGLFNESGPMLQIPDWLDQRFFSYKMTLRDFIRSVADKEGVHADKELNSALRLTKNVLFPGDETLAAKTIIAIARYVVRGCALRILVVSERTDPNVRLHATQRGRGIHVIDLHKFCQFGSHGAQFDFVPEAQISRLGAEGDADMAVLRGRVLSYDPRTQMLVLTIDLNRRARDVYGIQFQGDV